MFENTILLLVILLGLASQIKIFGKANNISYFNSITRPLVVSYPENERCSNIYDFKEVTLLKVFFHRSMTLMQNSFCGVALVNFLSYPVCRVVDPHHLNADPDPDSTDHHPDADPDVDPDSHFLFDADADQDPDPTFHPDTDPDQDPSFQINAQIFEKVLK